MKLDNLHPKLLKPDKFSPLSAQTRYQHSLTGLRPCGSISLSYLLPSHIGLLRYFIEHMHCVPRGHGGCRQATRAVALPRARPRLPLLHCLGACGTQCRGGDEEKLKSVSAISIWRIVAARRGSTTGMLGGIAELQYSLSKATVVGVVRLVADKLARRRACELP